MWLQIFSYICLLVFTTGLVWRIVRYAGLPVHLRWELYPVAHEKGKPYGGSYLEELDWWHHPQHTNPLGEFTVFMREILFFREYFKSNRGFWYFVYPFHIGLFLVLAWVMLLLIGTILQLNGFIIAAGAKSAWIITLYYLTLVAGIVAFVTGIFGSIGLLVKRIVDRDLRNYTDPIDYFNLICILTILILGLLAWFLEGLSFDEARSYISSLIVFKPSQFGPVTIAFILLSMLFLAYMPFTRMMHYVAKYFTYHKVKWDDEPNSRGSKLEEKVKLMLGQHETWAAPHIKPDCTWEEQAADTGIKEDSK